MCIKVENVIKSIIRTRSRHAMTLKIIKKVNKNEFKYYYCSYSGFKSLSTFLLKNEKYFYFISNGNKNSRVGEKIQSRSG